ncbi:MAG: hypothetical protein ABIG66_03530 [Candidatus Kerfeldbacteria bacterium]
MDETTQQPEKKITLRKDLLTIFVMAVALCAVLGVVLYFDITQDAITSWSHSFYQAILRQ